MPSLRRSVLACLALAIASVFSSFSARAQITNVDNTTSTPVAGAGHDYIHLLSETVNPANGSVSLRIQVPTSKGRGITLPFSFAYDSNSVHHLQPGYYPHFGTATWKSNTSTLGQGGWSYSVPTAGAVETDISEGSYPTFHTCNVYTNYVFHDPSGGSHALVLASSQSSGGTCLESPITPGGDPLFHGSLANGGNAWGNLSVSSADGTVYQFNNLATSSDGTALSLPSYIEDRNGNKIVSSTNGFTDTLGRALISWTGFGPSGTTNTVSVSSLSYQVTWKTITANFTVPNTWVGNTAGPSSQFDTCTSGVPNVNDSQTVVSQIVLPNGKSFTFYYGTDNPDTNFQNPYGLLSEIDYPSGAWVKYTYKLSDTMNELANYPGEINMGANACPNPGEPAFCPGPVQDGCLYQYKTPVVATRTVGFGGSSTPVLTQTFTYSTTWAPPTSGNVGGSTWTAKTTNVTTTDNVTGKNALIAYSYLPTFAFSQPYTHTTMPPQLPVESSIKYYDWGNVSSPLQTVTKTWYDNFNLASQQTTLETNQTSKVTYCYVGNNCSPSEWPYQPLSQLIEQDDYDFGASSPTRKTITTYQTFSGTPGVIAEAPCRVLIQNGSSTTISETDYLYDGGTSVCGSSGSAATTPVNNLPANTHDETAFSSSSSTPRGNVTKVIRKCLQSCPDSTTSYIFDETGQVLTKTDACGNATCADMSGSNHVTTYSYADNFDSPPSGNTNAYLTQITDPLGHTSKFKYALSDGQLISSTDQNNLTTSYNYSGDSLRRLTETDFPDGGYTKVCYTDAGGAICSQGSYPYQVLTRRAINFSAYMSTTSVSDGMGHTTQTQLTSDPQGTVYTDTTYDGFGRVRTQSNPYRLGTDATGSPGTTTFTYDALGRKLTETYPDNSVLTTSYCGPSTLVSDPTNRWRRSRFDGLGRLVEVDEPNSSATVNVCPGSGEPIWVTSYGFDILGNLTSVVQNGSHNRSFTYDSLSRLLTSTNPEVGTLTYTYDANSNVSTKKDARNITITYGYDVINREKSRTYSNGDPTVLINYDEANCLGFSPCQNIGHRTSMTDAAGSEAWSYVVGSGSSIHVDQRTTVSSSGNYTKASTFYLDLAGNITQTVYPSGRIVNYRYDSANRPSTATDAVNGLTYATGFQTTPLNTACVATSVCYTPQGTPYALSVGQSSAFTGLNITESYNNRLQPNQIKASSTGGSAFDITYSYVDPANGKNAGHVFSISNNLDTARSQTFGYDQLNRITSAHASTYATSPTKCWGETYSLDAWANLNSITPDPAFNGCSQEGGFSFTANGSNRLSGLVYDVSGNTTNDTAYNYFWNGESQQIYSTGSGMSAHYAYDGDGRRVSKAGSVEPKLYWYGSGGEILTETNPSALEIVDYVYFNGKRLAQLANDFNLNGGFESGLTNWSASGSGTATAITNATNAHSGSNYVDIVVPPSGAATKLTTTVPISAQQGETIIATAWVYREVGGQQYSQWWMFVNGSNGYVGGHSTANTTMNAWIQQTISTTVPTWLTGPYTVTMYAEVDSTSSTQSTSARFDDATLNGNTIFFAEDSLGTTRVITDSSGVVCYDADFYPYGGERPYTNTCTTHYKFEGKERDTETGNDDFGARYYSNRFGRWLSSDWSTTPIAVPYATLANPQTLNLYSMVGDDPETSADLNGHDQMIYKNGTVMSPLDPKAQPGPMSKTEKQIDRGIVEVSASIITGGTLGELAAAGKAVEAGLKAIGAAGLFVSGTTRIIAGAAGKDSDQKINEAAGAATTMTNPAGATVTILSGGDFAKGEKAAEVSSAVSLVRHPTEAAKNPADAALTVADVVKDIKNAAGIVIGAVSRVPPPSAPKPPSAPGCASNATGCH